MSKLSKLFDVFYTMDLPEAYRNIIADTVITESNPEELYTSLVESEEANKALTDLADLLSHTASTEKDLMEAIEILFETFNTDIIDAVTESLRERAVRNILLEREEALNELFGFGKKSDERKGAENILKASSGDVKKAQDALKRAQTKAKSTGSPIGLAGLDKGDKADRGVKGAQTKLNKALAAQKQAKSELGELKSRERKESVDRLKNTAKGIWNKFKEGAKSVANKVKDTAVAAKEGAKKGIASAARGIADGATKVADKLDPKAETATEAPKTEKDATERASRHLNTVKKKTLVPESCVPVVAFLSGTSISESCLSEIVELLITPEATKATLDKTETSLGNVLSAVNNDLADGKGIDSKKVEAAEKLASRADKIKKRYANMCKSNK